LTELIWEGKYSKDGKKQGPVRIALPFQTIETVNESAQDRRRNLELFASGRDTEWRNRLIWGDKKYVLPSLLPEFAGKVNLIYIDPPFDTGANFSFMATVPQRPDAADDEAISFMKEASIIEQKAYRDTWGSGLNSYLHWFCETTVMLHELLKDDGILYVHFDSRMVHYAKVLLDETFGGENFRNQIVWKRTYAHGNADYQFGQIHDTLLCYARSEAAKLNPLFVPYDAEYIATYFRLVEASTGRRYASQNLTNYNKDRPNLTYTWKGHRRTWLFSEEKMRELDKQGRIIYSKTGYPRLKQYLDESPGLPLGDLWIDIKPLKHAGAEVVPYPTQKPEALLHRILQSSSKEGDLVLDCFVGSGTTAAVAEKLNRRWIACDLSRFAIHTTRKRLLDVPDVKPFAVQNLGKYERQAWQAAEFPANGKNRLEEQCQREAAYRRFILDLYRAKPVSGYAWLHGVKAGRMVHVGAVDAPVTLADVKAIARETWKAVGTGKDAPAKAGVDILGWEFAFEVNELAKQVAAQSRVDVTFKKIPREVLDKRAVEQGDVRFFELGALSVGVKQKGREVSLKLTDFVIPTDDIPDDARNAIKHWSQLIDYWAVDWDYKSDTFHNQWQTYRTRKDPKISLDVSYLYPQGGKYTIVVKVIDILGNDTTKTLEVQVK
jgi:adenine-specific DNA-methyltransferase